MVLLLNNLLKKTTTHFHSNNNKKVVQVSQDISVTVVLEEGNFYAAGFTFVHHLLFHDAGLFYISATG